MPAGRPRESRKSAPVADSRVLRSKELILRTTFALLVEKGMGGVSVDEVSSRSGVAKTTIYRHWKSRSELVFEACTLASGSPPVPDYGGLEPDLTRSLLGLANQLENATWPKVLLSVVDAGERDTELAQATAERQRKQSAPYLTAIAHAKERGELAASVDASAMVAQLVGPLFYRRWFTREPLDEKFVKHVVASVLDGVRRKGDRPAEKPPRRKRS